MKNTQQLRETSWLQLRVSIPLRGIGYEKRSLIDRNGRHYNDQVSIPLRGIGYEKLMSGM